ncbi:hypothetical protein C8J56DRAFT_914482 [Mycena floridula]|nr:hypothetical protein C8J56DRAFT_914482 [Mycena floridula]
MLNRVVTEDRRASMSDYLSPFPRIPNELVCSILREAVEEDRLLGFQLVLVARHVQRWIDPLIYRVIELETDKSVDSLAMTIANSSKSATFFADHVKVLCLGSQIRAYNSDENLRLVLSSCTGLISLRNYNSTLEFPPTLLKPHQHLRRLTGISIDDDETLSKLPGSNLPSITHVELHQVYDEDRLHQNDNLLRQCDNLTHILVEIFAMSVAELLEMVDAILSRAPKSLHVLLFRVGCLIDATFTRADIEQCDPRCVFVISKSITPDIEKICDEEALDLVLVMPESKGPGLYEEWKAQWGHHLPGELDIWEIAEQFLANRSRGFGKGM